MDSVLLNDYKTNDSQTLPEYHDSAGYILPEGTALGASYIRLKNQSGSTILIQYGCVTLNANKSYSSASVVFPTSFQHPPYVYAINGGFGTTNPLSLYMVTESNCIFCTYDTGAAEATAFAFWLAIGR